MCGEKQFPKFLQNELVEKVFRCLHSFTDDEISELTEFYRALWAIEENYETLQASRLELLKILVAIKMQKIEMEKRVLQKQINQLTFL